MKGNLQCESKYCILFCKFVLILETNWSGLEGILQILMFHARPKPVYLPYLLLPSRGIKMWSMRLNFFAAPKKSFGFGPVNEKTRLNFSDLFREGKQKHIILQNKTPLNP